MIEFIDVHKSYHLKGVQKTILDGLTFAFPPDKNVAILGQNGAGKSTLLRLISGAELPDRGRIRRNAKISWPLGFGGGFNGQMTGLENVRFIARMYGEDTEEIVDYVKSFSELGESIRLPIKTYSSGMRARLAFGVSMAIDFTYYLIDEVTAVGDARFKKKCEKVFEEKMEQSKIIMISHSSGTIRKFCDAGYILNDGTLTAYDSIDAAIRQHEENQKR